MNASQALLEMLKGYDVSHVFGLPGETTLPLYKEWVAYPEIKHVLARDERSSVFMADAYARFSFKPGVCEGPSVGSTHMMPGVAEAYKAGSPIIVLTSDIPLRYEKRNMLTGLDQTSLFQGITKESMTVTDPSELPNLVRRAYRIATTGKPGPVHIRIPHDVLGGELDEPMLYIQRDFTRYPGHRPLPPHDKILESLSLMGEAGNPVLICGQGVLFSQAWEEVRELAEIYGMPVGTTINGKGSFPETHPLSIGVVGARGGTDISNAIVSEADLILFVGCSTDSAGTDKWSIPPRDTEAKIIQIDISGVEAGNNYPADVILLGDARATLREMIEETCVSERIYMDIPRIREIREALEGYEEYVRDLASSNISPVHPVRFVRELQNRLPEDFAMVVDVGTAAIYSSTFFKTNRGGRSLMYNFAMGALGFAIPASIGARFARPDSCVVGLVGDGSFALASGELETISRVGGNVNLFLFNNQSYGWIKAELLLSYGREYMDFSTNFKPVDYIKIAEGFGLKGRRISKPEDIQPILEEVLEEPEPSFTEVLVSPEDELVPPVPRWKREAKRRGIRHIK
ncbi:MAG: thiamine pyrophosphate-binding protein [Candidatus Bathyarchaeia archaeon]